MGGQSYSNFLASTVSPKDCWAYWGLLVVSGCGGSLVHAISRVPLRATAQVEGR